MDPKALAKSKRSHTQHHSTKSHHPNQKPRAPSAASVESGNQKKPSGKQTGGKPHQSKAAASLPSNWDRYEEEFDSISENPSLDAKNPASADVVLPKSKGADYGHLISEARAQPHSDSYLEPFASLGDVFPDFNQGVGSILSSRGQSIRSWTEDGNFIVDDRATTSHEAPFLSLNLNTLAEQLAKVDLSQRLFIEPDLLPSEMSSDATEQSKTWSSEAAIPLSDPSAHDLSEKDETTVQIIKSPTTSPRELRKPMLLSMRFLGIDQSKGLEPEGKFTGNSVVDADKKLHVFEGSSSEAELDMLLDSFNETKFLDSTGSAKNPSNSLVVPGEIPAGSQQIPRPGPKLSDSVSSTANFDNAIDDLLEETANFMDQKGASERQVETETASLDVCSSVLPTSNVKPKVLDDFDSWLDTI